MGSLLILLRLWEPARRRVSSLPENHYGERSLEPGLQYARGVRRWEWRRREKSTVYPIISDRGGGGSHHGPAGVLLRFFLCIWWF